MTSFDCVTHRTSAVTGSGWGGDGGVGYVVRSLREEAVLCAHFGMALLKNEEKKETKKNEINNKKHVTKLCVGIK